MNWLNEKEKRIVFWAMLVIMLVYLGFALVNLNKVGVMEYCYEFNGTRNCYKTQLEAEIYAKSISYPKNLDYNYINNYTYIEDMG